MTNGVALNLLVTELRGLIEYDLAACCQISHWLPLTADYYRDAVQVPSDGVCLEMEPHESEVYELLRELEAEGWDGRSGLEDFDGPFIRRKH